jgi:hypothetical protein
VEEVKEELAVDPAKDKVLEPEGAEALEEVHEVVRQPEVQMELLKEEDVEERVDQRRQRARARRHWTKNLNLGSQAKAQKLVMEQELTWPQLDNLCKPAGNYIIIVHLMNHVVLLVHVVRSSSLIKLN